MLPGIMIPVLEEQEEERQWSLEWVYENRFEADKSQTWLSW